MDDYARGASSSLNRSVAELERFVGKSSSRFQSAETGLRGRLNTLIWQIGRRGFEAGYREAHAQCARLVEENGEFPTTMSFSGRPKLAPSADGLVVVRASIQKVRLFKLPSFSREISFWDRFKRS
jgi:hypothetical protein